MPEQVLPLTWDGFLAQPLTTQFGQYVTIALLEDGGIDARVGYRALELLAKSLTEGAYRHGYDPRPTGVRVTGTPSEHPDPLVGRFVRLGVSAQYAADPDPLKYIAYAQTLMEELQRDLEWTRRELETMRTWEGFRKYQEEQTELRVRNEYGD